MLNKVLVIGSGPIVIGQAAEFDYSGSQACRALHEEGLQVVLVNPNPATIMTDEHIADVVYMEPLTVEVLARVIAQERPDGLLPTLGGQTGLNLAVALAEAGVLDEYNVHVLGTPLHAIRQAEDRELFRALMREIGEPVLDSVACHTLDEALAAADHLGYPVIVRPAFTLGGTGGGVAFTPEELTFIVRRGLSLSPTSQVLVERYLEGWREIEYEVMRDAGDTCIAVCNMENVDPLGIHTGDSIVVAPSQTLTDREYQQLRAAAFKIIRALGVEGGCNIQFALAPDGDSYYVIEVNPRVSRSSALASKATGYPIARVAAKIAIGKRLDEIPNAVTGQTSAAFEPALDYVVVKIPRWPFDKFAAGERRLGSQMKSTGEVMAIARTFPAALQKAVRGLELGRTLLWEDPAWELGNHSWGDGSTAMARLRELIRTPTDVRLWALMAALRRGASPEELAELSHISVWFLRELSRITAMQATLRAHPPEQGGTRYLRAAKRLGIPDRDIAQLWGISEETVRALRYRLGIRSVFKSVDTCAAEFAAQTPYFYADYEEENEAHPLPGPKAVVLGSGPIRIGQGVEFDYCSVHAVQALQKAEYRAILINCNPETVSTDFDTSDRLYFEPLDAEAVLDILDNEGVHTTPVLVGFSGQTGLNLAEPLQRAGARLLGANAEAIDLAEDRERFDEFMEGLGIPRPPGAAVTSITEAVYVAQRVGYPVLVRPSYVLGGRAMQIVHSEEELRAYLTEAAEASPERPILVDKYLRGVEVEVDAVCDGGDILIPGIMEHVERAGVHSGDSFAVYPPLHLLPHHVQTVVFYTERIARRLGIRGILNIQFIIHEGRIYVLEVNPRASRTVPFLAKVTGVPLPQLATHIALGRTLRDLGYPPGLWPRQPLVAVKAPVFSTAKLSGVDAVLGPEMKSTGEAIGIDVTFSAAFTKALMAAGVFPQLDGRPFFFSIADTDKEEALPLAVALHKLGIPLVATAGTARFLQRAGVPVQGIVRKLSEGSPHAVDYIRQGQVAAVINTEGRSGRAIRDGFAIRRAAVEHGIPCFTSLDTVQALIAALEAQDEGYHVLPVTSYRQGSIRPPHRFAA